MLERAGVADEIYRLALTKDSMMFPETLDGKEYLPVIDERFATVRDIQDFLDQTFTKGGEAAKRFEELQAEAVYTSINNQLYILREGRQKPLTLCGWRIDSMELLLLDDKQLEARMETTMAGQPDGKRVLRIIRDGESWLLGDSFFFD